MKRCLFHILMILPVVLSAQKDSIMAGVYEWKQPGKTSGPGSKSTILFEGSTRDMSWLQMSANSLDESGNKTQIVVPENEEFLFIVKKGSLSVSLNDTNYDLVGGSVALILPGQNISIQNKGAKASEYYIMKYTSKLPEDKERGLKAGGSFIKDWTTIPFKPHGKGGIRNFFQRATAMTKRMEMHVTTLNAGIKSHDPHTHRAAEIVLMMDGDTEMQIGDKFYKGKPGSVFYLASGVLHAIRNEGTIPSTYFAFQFE